MIPQKLAICVTFHYVEERLKYLDLISSSFAELADEVAVHIVTNTHDLEHQETIVRVLKEKGFSYSFLTPSGLGHPFLLTWSHFSIFRRLVKDPSFTHFLYLEDDTLITRENMEYWLEGRQLLKRTGCYPSFLRVERRDGSDQWLSTDCLTRHFVEELPSVRPAADKNKLFVSVPTPYQGMYLLDREQMIEHLEGPSSIPEGGNWPIREKAARGLTFAARPKGFFSRNLLLFDTGRQQIDCRSFIHHTPNNYANDHTRTDGFGTIPALEVLNSKTSS